MHQQWEDLIPFYIARTLPAEESRALEQHLAQCTHCQQTVNEWRVIASGVWRQTDTLARNLPPMAEHVRQHATQSAPSRQQIQPVQKNEQGYYEIKYHRLPEEQPTARRFSRVPVTMAAALVTMVLFGGILLLALGSLPQDISLTPQTVADNSNQAAPSLPESPSPEGGSSTPEITTNNTILSTPTLRLPAASSTPSPLPPRPTNTPFPSPVVGNSVASPTLPLPPSLPPNSGGGSTEMLAPVATNDPFFGVPECTITNTLGQALNIYQWADPNSAIIGSFPPNAAANVQVMSPDGQWIQLNYGNWVQANAVAQSGTCNLWIATPTQISIPTEVVENCVVTNVSGGDLQLYQWANAASSVTGVLRANETATIRIRSADWQWLEIRYGQWIPTNQVAGNGQCTNLWTATPTISGLDNGRPTVTSLPTFTPTPTPLASTPPNQIQTGVWEHVSTIQEHGCGGTVGQSVTIPLTIQKGFDESWVQLTYTTTGTTFTLNRIAPLTYSGNYGSPSTVAITLTFTSATTYTANETVTHESGCIVRSSWNGRLSQ